MIEFLTFEDFWAAQYDNETVTIDQIIQDLNSSSAIYQQTVDWFVGYFGPQGYVTLDYVLETGNPLAPATPATTPTESINVPEGLEAIVAWLEAHVESEIKKRCP